MWKVVSLSCRRFHTASYQHAKMGKILSKVMGMRNASKKKRIFSESGVLPNAEMFSKGSNEGRYSGSARRVSVLNKLFMKYITDLLATGEYSKEFTGHGIEINRVQISPDYTGLNVFWIANGTQNNDEVVEKLLKKNAGFLRHELSSLRVIGNVPQIHFLKDKQQTELIELDSRLAKADFGEDHVPIEMTTKLKTQLELFTHLPSEIKEKIQQLDAALSDNDLDDDDELPPMTQNVLGLDHLEILNRIKRSMKKGRASQRCNKNDPIMEAINENPIEFINNKEKREAFKEFLKKRELLRSNSRKEDKNYYPDTEYIRQELEERRAEYFRNLEIYEDEERDYIEDRTEVDNRIK
ncbi:hypothetical protein Zmor_021806 [Zophobas morio]|uniref:Ribosome-binding factor A, mitochondrial n=1 Tax=Zophobas morio TaxID=2755281 RepID=A0AA38I388_9CUCU|nr:hypothetical protein Zmor_021806 [Zophobas morio]